MRVTSSMYYKSLYGSNNNQLSTKLFDVNKQIASGLKIQYAKDDIATFTETMRLDNEITTLNQIQKSTESGYKISNQTDTVLNEFSTSMDRVRTLLIQASNGASSDTSLDAIASELRGMEDHLKNLANTSINGQYLFSGSAVDIRPISDDGTYNGNNISMNSFLGSRVEQQYNISGDELFLGEEILVKRTITSNVVQTLNEPDSTSTSVLPSSTMSEFMGDSPSDKHYFYLRGVQSDGTAFNKQIPMTDTNTVDDLLIEIGKAYGNTGNLDLVNVSLNTNGQIVVEDKIKGSSKLDFHLVGATDFGGTGAADIDDSMYNHLPAPGIDERGKIDNLSGGTTNYDTATVSGSETLYIKEFTKSGFTSSEGVLGAEGLIYDRTQFSKEGSTISSNVPQILKSSHIIDVNGIDTETISSSEKNAFAQPSTLLSEVADISKGTPDDTSDDTLSGTNFILSGENINGDDYSVKISLDSGGSKFILDTNNDGDYDDVGDETYDIFNMEDTRVATDADEMTYQQLMDVMNMVVTDNLPISNDADEYDKAIYNSNFSGTTSLSYDGKIQFNDLSAGLTKATISLYDLNSGDFSDNYDSDGDTINDTNIASAMSFNSNNALTIRDPKTDFFKTIDEMIKSVENHILYPDDALGDKRSVGIENAITMMDDLQEHVTRSHAQVGANSNALTASLARTSILEISTQTLRSSVIDTDIAEASLTLTQLNLNYEAMLSTVGKISKLSLVNYL
ncbi:MAG: flagellar biosynthesis protein FlgL [Sulfurimonas sp.]|nr:flagellar biosynthesis protein FlgL [Sulfurimonas sp.]